uniref:Uncharacterized protein n=1 Tax=Knipowitschia caucasica TaxID=637954 RepID=A0AAV2K5Q4_KNICA
MVKTEPADQSTGRKLTPAVQCAGQKPTACSPDAGNKPSAGQHTHHHARQKTREKQRDDAAPPIGGRNTHRPPHRPDRLHAAADHNETTSSESAEGPRKE